ncbi:MAG: hypothetical protein RSB20_00710 [Clostridia bacterium]
MTIALTVIAVTCGAFLLYKIAEGIVAIIPFIWRLIKWFCRRVKDFFFGLYFVVSLPIKSIKRKIRVRKIVKNKGNAPQPLPQKTDEEITQAIDHFVGLVNSGVADSDGEGEENAD